MNLTNFQTVVRSARMSLWPIIFVNTGIITYLNSGSIPNAVILSFSLSCAASFGFLINDLYDVPVDRVNQSRRLENASKKEMALAWLSAVLFLTSSIVLGTLINSRAVASVGLIDFGLAVYTLYARRKLLLATILAAVLSSSPLWLSDIIFTTHLNFLHLGLACVSVLLLMGREIIFDVQDSKGDSATNRRTFATVFSSRFALKLSLYLNIIGSICLLLLAIYMAVNSGFGLSSLRILAAVTLCWLLLYPTYRLERDPKFDHFTKRSRIAMFLLPLFWLGL